MKKITILLPIHILGDDEAIMLANALTSIEDFHNDIELKIICPPDIYKKLEDFDFGQKLSVNFATNDSGNTDFATQINLGIDLCKTEWFSILEIDDEFKPSWVASMNEHINAYKDVDVFLPVVKDIKPSGEFLAFTNESTWAYGFTDKQGFLDNEVLLEYQNYQTSGGLFRTEVIKQNGKFKENIKLTFTYEFLLRLTHNGVVIMTSPRIGYQHTNLRENSLFWDYKNKETMLLSENDIKFWVETARKEYFYKNKREIIQIEP